jgi:electron transfer flavoprotein beta subunit
MKIIVLLKQTFDTEEQIVIEDGRIVDEEAKLVINPYDEYAVEEAVRIKENLGAEVTVVTLGPKKAEEAVRSALAMGADHAVHIVAENFQGDEHSVAKMLAAVIRGMEFDLILAGNMAVDDGSAQVGPRVAEELGIAHVSTAVNVEIKGGNVTVERDAEGESEWIEASLPLLITTQQGLNEPRYPALPNIMKAKRKPIRVITLEDLQPGAGDWKEKTAVVETYLPPAKKSGRILQGAPSEQAKQLVQALCQEEKLFERGFM